MSALVSQSKRTVGGSLIPKNVLEGGDKAEMARAVSGKLHSRFMTEPRSELGSVSNAWMLASDTFPIAHDDMIRLARLAGVLVDSAKTGTELLVDA